jgi:integrase
MSMAVKRQPTKYPGVFFRIGKRLDGPGEERIYYAVWKDSTGKVIETRVGRQYKDKMTASQANQQRSLLMTGKEKTGQQKREEAKKKRWTFDSLWESYRADQPDNKSMAVDGNRYEKYLKPAIGKKLPSELASTDIDRLKQRALKGKSPQTIKHVIHLVKRLCNYGVNNALCPGPAFKLKTPEVHNKVTETLSSEELKRLVEVLDEYPNIQVANLLKLAMVTGMRRGELFKLEWHDVNFESGTIHLRDPKGKEDVFLPMNDLAREILQYHHRIEGSPFVFPGTDGKQRVSIQNASRIIREKAGLPQKFRMAHGLRHFYASSLVNAGVGLYEVQKLLGHKSASVTARYAHLHDDRLKKASSAIGSVFQSAKSEDGEPDE